MTTAGKVETKVTAATSAALVSSAVVILLGEYVFKGEVPRLMVDAVYVIVPAVSAFVAGWWAKHTPR